MWWPGATSSTPRSTSAPTARHDNDSAAWGYLAVAAVGAVACLFLGFMLVARFSRAMGLTQPPDPKPKRDPELPKGGKRAAR